MHKSLALGAVCHVALGLAAAAGLLAAATPVAALDIVIDYRNGPSHPPGGDADGSRLIDIVNAAAAVWESLIQDSHSIEVNIWYDNPSSLPAPTTIAATGHDIAFPATPPNSARIRFNNTANFYYDPSPGEDSNFNMAPTLYNAGAPYLQDLPSGFRAGGANAYYRGNVPGVFEAGYEGTATTGTPAASGCDLLTTALHELGHAIGMAQEINGVSNETNPDDDYDIEPFHLGSSSTTMAVITTPDPSFASGFDHSHIAASISASEADSYALMAPRLAAGVRRRPSATDVLPLARAMGWTHVNLDRKYLADDGTGTVDWVVDNNWIGGRSPSTAADSSAYIVDSAITDVRFVFPSAIQNFMQTTAKMQLQSTLTINGKGLVSGPGTQLLVNGPAGQVMSSGSGSLDINRGAYMEIGTGNSVSDLNGLSTNVQLPPGFASDSVIIRHLGTILMGGDKPTIELQNGGIVMTPGATSVPVIDGAPYSLELGDDGYLEGGGNVLNVRKLNNNGRIEAIQTTLLIADDVAGSSKPFDLDGSDVGEKGQLKALQADLWFQGYVTEPFNGSAEVGQHRTLGFDISRTDTGGGEFTLGEDGSIKLKGGTVASLGAILAAQRANLLDGTVEVTGYASIEAPNGIRTSGAFPNGLLVSVPLDSTLVLHGPITYGGVKSMGGEGSAVQEGDATVVADTHIGHFGTRYDWDGMAETSNTEVRSGVTFSMSVGRIDSLLDGYDGEITLRDASTLDVQTDAGQWQLDGTMTLHNATVTGDDIINYGDILGTGAIEADVVNHGVIAPGLSPGALTVDGNLVQGSSAIVEMEIEGLFGGEYDNLNVSGDLTLAGALDVTLSGAFKPAPGQSWNIIQVDGKLSGGFADLSEGGLVASLAGTNLLISYAGGDGNDVVLTATAALAGDYNGNGVVDAADYVVWRKGWEMGTYAQADYDVWRAHFGQTAGGGAAVPSAEPLPAGVPEPPTMSICLMAMVVMLFRRARDRVVNHY